MKYSRALLFILFITTSVFVRAAPIVPRNIYNQPFVLDHKIRTKNVAVLMHGLTDSPYFVRSIGDALYNDGWNVVGVLLHGDGTKPEDLLNVQLSDWKQDVQIAIRKAATLGDNLVIGGFSTGGALAIDQTLFPTPATKNFPVRGLVLFSPAVQFAFPLSPLSCALSPVAKWVIDVPETSAFHYSKMPLNAVCQLNKLMEEIGHDSRGADISVPVFMAMSDDDKTINTEAMHHFADTLRGPRELIAYPQGEGIAHISVSIPNRGSGFPRGNPHFNDMMHAMIGFLGQHVPN